MLGTLPQGQTGVAMGPASTLRQIGAAFGVAIMGGILNSGYRDSLSGVLGGLSAQLRSVAEGSLAGGAAVARHLHAPASSSLLQNVYQAYAAGMSGVMLVCAGVTIVGALIVGLFLPVRAVANTDAGQAAEVDAGESAVA